MWRSSGLLKQLIVLTKRNDTIMAPSSHSPVPSRR